MNTRMLFNATALAALLLFNADGRAADAQPDSVTQAAALESEAEAMEADIDKSCQKVARQARALCHAQYARAVQGLRARAARLR